MTPARDYYQPQRQLVSQNDRAIIESARVPRSKFIGSWTRKMAFDAGYLVPFLVDEILPGDKMNYTVTAYVRMSTPLFPIFDAQRIDTFFFYSPARILWDAVDGSMSWAKFMGEQDNPGDSTAGLVPTILSGIDGVAVGSLADHMGIPPGILISTSAGTDVSALPFRAYNRIYNDWFRDQNLINKAAVLKGNGPDAEASYVLQRRAKSHDYFTSALPNLQKGAAPTIAMSGLAPIQGIGFAGNSPSGGVSAPAETLFGLGNAYVQSTLTSTAGVYIETDNVTGFPMIYANLAAATGININDFRAAMMIQSMLERDARGGTRYVEQIRAHFGVTNPDFRLQRPEYIGGGQTGLNVTPVAQTAPATGPTSVVGALGAAATAAGQHRASFAATEHGYIIGLINVRSELSYQQGIHKMWQRRIRIHFYTPELAHLGEQAINRSEIYATENLIENTTVFGYQERFHEYRTRHSEVTGIMRSGVAGTLDMWHLAQYFPTPPTLSQAFIEDTPDMERVLAAGEASTGQQYLADLLISRVAVRPMPMFGTPATLGRF